MEKQFNFKRYISLIICSVVLLFSLINNYSGNSNVIAGKGKGENSKITTIDEVVDVLDFFSKYQLKSPNQTISLSSLAKETPKYTSATFYNKSKVSNSYSSKYVEGKRTSNNSSITRELTIYLTQTCAYYKSAGLVMESSSVNSDGETTLTSMIFDFDMEFYFTKEDCYIKFNKFDIVASDDNTDAPINVITDEMYGKWFDAEDVADSFLSINEENYEQLSEMGEYFEEKKDTDFTHSNGVYKLKKELWGEGIVGDFTLNLTNKTKPTITLIKSINITPANTIDYNSTSSQVSYAENNIYFTNINNTVVTFKDETIYDINDFINEEDLW